MIELEYNDSSCKLDTLGGLTTEFDEELLRAVPYSSHSALFFLANSGIKLINSYCGITTSECSKNALAAAVTETSWHQATH